MGFLTGVRGRGGGSIELTLQNAFLEVKELCVSLLFFSLV